MLQFVTERSVESPDGAFSVMAATACDFYKTGHIFQYPKNTDMVYSNFTPRSDRLGKVLLNLWDKKVVVWGIQGMLKFVKELWDKTFFLQDKAVAVGRYKRRMDTALGKGAVDVSHISALWELGFLPIIVKSLPEGSKCNIGVPVLTIRNDWENYPEFYWVTNYLETIISAELWKLISVATISYQYRKLLEKYAEETGSAKEFIPWQGHDFSMRGMSGVFDAASASSGHLLSFFGTDTIPAIDYLEYYYGANADSELIGGSVPATEHSVMCMGGNEDEIGTFRRLITEVYPAGVVSIVSDTWDFWKVITEYAKELKEEILNRKLDPLGMAKVVFRPDSGDPVKIICGEVIEDLTEECQTLEDAKELAKEIIVEDIGDETPHGECGVNSKKKLFMFQGKAYKAEASVEWNRHDKQFYFIDGSKLVKFEEVELTPEQKGAVQCLYEIFGGDKTEKGYITLNQRVGLIYGDSITLERAQEILVRLKNKGFSAGNIVFGIGSYTYQYITRDTFGQAIKATAGIVDGELRELFKDPVTDSGTKKSAKGLLRVEKEGDNFVLYDQQTWEQEGQGALETIFVNGKFVKETTLAEARARLLG